jgi:hypothetical protein
MMKSHDFQMYNEEVISIEQKLYQSDTAVHASATKPRECRTMIDVF